MNESGNEYHFRLVKSHVGLGVLAKTPTQCRLLDS